MCLYKLAGAGKDSGLLRRERAEDVGGDVVHEEAIRKADVLIEAWVHP